MKCQAILFLALLTHAACNAPPQANHTALTQSAPPDCKPYAELMALEERYDGIYLGELHGSMNTPQILECFILAERTHNRDLIISLEMDHNDRSRLSEDSLASGAKGLGTGTPPIHALIAKYADQPDRVQFRYHDGYYSGRSYEDKNAPSFASYTPPKIQGQPLPANTAQKRWPPIPNARERSIGDAIKRDMSGNTFVLALGGNLHASRATWQEAWGPEGRAGSYLPETVTTVLLSSSKGGQLRFCSDRDPAEGPHCDLYPISEKPQYFPNDAKLVIGSKAHPALPDYDFMFDVGTWIAIPAPTQED